MLSALISPNVKPIQKYKFLEMDLEGKKGNENLNSQMIASASHS